MVHVLQYPNRYVTGDRSQRFHNGREQEVDNNGNMRPVYADFRYHSTLGVFGKYQGETRISPQINDVNFKITTVVPREGERIGSPVDPVTGLTKTDHASNQLISPQFIIASQHGMTFYTYQMKKDVPSNKNREEKFSTQAFSAEAPYYGPLSSAFWGSYPPYTNPANYADGTFAYQGGTAKNQTIVAYYFDAQTRCFEYFEGEFGTNDNYKEFYNIEVGAWNRFTWQTRIIHKEFKYQGRWRIPTSAEMKLIDEMQIDNKTEIEGLLFGSYYWVAEEGMVYDFLQHKVITFDEMVSKRGRDNSYNDAGLPTVYVRPIFDTYMYDEQ